MTIAGDRAEYERNKLRYAAKSKEYQQMHKESLAEYNRSYHRLKKYGLTKDACDILLAMQDDKCACCGEPLNGKFTVDHNHACCDSIKTCGKCIRGLLCMNCNAGLGNFKDDVTRLLKAIRYLRH
jgi:hypothetical protein